MEGRSAPGELVARRRVRERADAEAPATGRRVEEVGAGTSSRHGEVEMMNTTTGPRSTTRLGAKRKRAADDQQVAVQQQVPRPAVVLAPSPLQRLLDACRATFGVPGAPPMASIVPYIRGRMDMIDPDDVGLRDEVRFFNWMNARGHQNPPIIAVFFVPFGTVMPLHDHPDMTVFSKVLMGSARLEAYDWVPPRIMWRHGSWMLAEKVRDHNVTKASGTWMLFPDGGGNLHRFVTTEEEHCAELMSIRFCVSLLTGVVEGGQTRRLTWLKEALEPRSMRIMGLPYQGPQII
ncbi:hypothetical protein HU200_064223 [Digitaria exilis]|uniref:cysteine dioxygenase n=1 Tax=Digitaria exilis TaxID=1010633 RepID=A0A835A631_9POAL|nr:hypothetical protein HU200_064223 [Digitaria exilis]